MGFFRGNYTAALVHKLGRSTFIGWIALLVISIPSRADPMARDCKIYSMSNQNGNLSNFEKKAISSFKKFTRNKISKFEICTVRSDENEIFYSFEKNVDKPPVPGSDFFVILNKKTLKVEILEGK